MCLETERRQRGKEAITEQEGGREGEGGRARDIGKDWDVEGERGRKGR